MTRFDLGATWSGLNVRLAFVSMRMLKYLMVHHPGDLFRVEGWDYVGQFRAVGADRHNEFRIYFVREDMLN